MIDRNSKEYFQKYYRELLSIWQNQEYEPCLADETESIVSNPLLSNFLQHSPCVTWIFNLRSLKFEFISANSKDIFGYDPEVFKENGLDFCNRIKHPEDLSQTWKLLKKVWDYIMSVPPIERKHYKFNYDYRILKPNGEEVRILEQNSVLQQDSRGNIINILGICNDITSWKSSKIQIASITSRTGQSVLFLLSDESPSSQTPPILSKRELEIIRLLAKGFNSKYIADKLSISFHTVNTHRQNMLQKTGVKNTGELISLAIYHDLI